MNMNQAKPYAYRNQPLTDHIIGCLKHLEIFLQTNPNYPQVVCTRLKDAGIEYTEPSIIEDMLRLGTGIHDLGKAYRLYQERVERYGGGFKDHEVLSAVSCYKIMIDSENRELKVLMLMAILNHHQAFRENLPNIITGLLDQSARNVLRVASSGLCDTVHNLDQALEKLGLSVESAFPRDYQEFKDLFDKMRGMLDLYLRRRFDENRKWLKLYNLLMFPIILADNLDAYEKRSGSASNRLIIRELRRAIDDE